MRRLRDSGIAENTFNRGGGVEPGTGLDALRD